MNSKNSKKANLEAAKVALNTRLQEFIKEYPGVDVESILLEEHIKNVNVNKKSEMAAFKAHVKSTFGTQHEMNFYSIEDGLMSALLADGKNALKEIIEEIPIEIPVNKDGEKFKNRGNEKKHNLFLW